MQPGHFLDQPPHIIADRSSFEIWILARFLHIELIGALTSFLVSRRPAEGQP
jgi:hypothetical protein